MLHKSGMMVIFFKLWFCRDTKVCTQLYHIVVMDQNQYLGFFLSFFLYSTFIFFQGLKVFDNSVENFASGAWQALGSALKGGTNFVQKYVSCLSMCHFICILLLIAYGRRLIVQIASYIESGFKIISWFPGANKQKNRKKNWCLLIAMRLQNKFLEVIQCEYLISS